MTTAQAPIAYPPIYASPSTTKVIGAMIGPSYRAPMNLEEVLPWTEGVNLSLAPKLPETSWIYGTPYWDQLTEAQRLEVLWLENARDISMFILLEQYLPPMYMGYLSAFGEILAPEVDEYMRIFSKEELVHTLVFRRYMKVANLPLYKLPVKAGYRPVMDMLEHSPKTTPPVVGVMWTLVVEWAAELNAMHGTQAAGVDPLTKKLFREHHVDEVRHIAFGQRVVEDFFNVAPENQKNFVRALFKPAVKDLIDEFTFTEEICDMTSFKFPIASTDADAIQKVRESASNIALNKARFKDLNEWLEKLGMA